MRAKSLSCIVCGRALKNVFPDVDNQPSDGLAFGSWGAYGTTVFDPMDGSRLEVNVCDPCLTAAAKAKRVMQFPPGHRTTTHGKLWKGGE